mmetsp:Transcript_20426/g.51982  ORF Transcript_20426/g.51982 Transcript_20426/m.51982 type:complete len:257 (+) Transcript_20426:970-1740(+)
MRARLLPLEYFLVGQPCCKHVTLVDRLAHLLYEEEVGEGVEAVENHLEDLHDLVGCHARLLRRELIEADDLCKEEGTVCEVLTRGERLALVALLLQSLEDCLGEHGLEKLLALTERALRVGERALARDLLLGVPVDAVARHAVVPDAERVRDREVDVHEGAAHAAARMRRRLPRGSHKAVDGVKAGGEALYDREADCDEDLPDGNLLRRQVDRAVARPDLEESEGEHVLRRVVGGEEDTEEGTRRWHRHQRDVGHA